MALKPKSGTLRIRIDPELLEAFRVICARRGMNVSDGVRRFMEDKVGLAYQSAKESQVAAEKVRAISPLALVEKPPVDGSDKPEGDVARRMRLKKESKAAKAAKRDEI